MKEKNIKSPCIGVCSTGIGDSVCRGCKRYAHEVIDWNGYTQDQRALIYGRITGFLSQVVSARIQVVNSATLNAFIRAQRVPTLELGDDYARLFALLKVGAQQIQSLECIGCQARDEFKHLDLRQLRDQIDRDFYILSCAHYERYFPH